MSNDAETEPEIDDHKKWTLWAFAAAALLLALFGVIAIGTVRGCFNSNTQQAADSLEQCIEATHEGSDFSRRTFRRERTQVACLAPLHFLSQAVERQDRATDAEPDEERKDRQGKEKREQQVRRDPGRNFAARFVALGDLDEESALRIPGAEHAPTLPLDRCIAVSLLALREQRGWRVG